MHVMEEFGEDEPKEVMVLWTTKSGDLAWCSTADSISQKIGMLEFAKAFILADCFKHE